MDLANELLEHIFGYLSFDDLMTIKNVNERFSSLVQNVLRLRVVLIKDVTDDKSATICRPFGCNERFLVSSFLLGRSMINFKINTDIHQHLTKLIFYNPCKLFNLTSGFDNLLNLEIQLVSYALVTKPSKFIFKLGNLRRLTYRDKTSSSLRFILDTPKLTYLKINTSSTHFKVMHPKTVEELHCLSNIAIESFVNLKALYCRNLHLDRERSLKPLKKLERFFFYTLDNFSFNAAIDYFETCENENLSIYYKSISLDAEPHPLESEAILKISLQRLRDHDLQLYETNLAHLGENPMQIDAELQELDARSMAIVHKLTNLCSLTLTGEVRDEEKWKAILQLPMLSELQLRCKMSQAFLDQIPTHCRNLFKLDIQHFDNLNFVLQLNNLAKFTTNQFFDFHLLCTMIRKLQKLRTVRTSFYGIEITAGRVRCKLDGSANLFVLDELKEVFVQMIHSIDDWTNLFKLDDL